MDNNAENLRQAAVADQYTQQQQFPTTLSEDAGTSDYLTTTHAVVDSQPTIISGLAETFPNHNPFMVPTSTTTGTCVTAALSTVDATGFDNFANYDLNIPFMSPKASSQLYMEAITSAGFSIPPASRSEMPREIKGSDINLLDWYKPSTNSSSATSLMVNSSSSIDFTMPVTTSPPKPCMPSKRRVTIPHTGSGRKPHSLHNASHSDEHFFCKAVQHHRLVDLSKKSEYKVHMFPQIDRGFFQSGYEWTCYRRNYFQISSYFWLSMDGRPVSHPITYPLLLQLSNDSPGIRKEYSEESGHLTDQQDHLRVVGFSLGISAHISEGKVPVELVQHTPKRDKGPQTIPQPQPIEPSSDGTPDVDNKLNVVSFERLQFKTATANNGKRRAAQQYYVLSLHIYAQCDNGEQVLLATTSSSPVVVRGRSPGHYADGGGVKRRTASTTNISLPDMARRQSLLDANLRLRKQQQQLNHDHRQHQQLLQAPLNMMHSSGSGSGFADSKADAASVFTAAAAAVAASGYNILANEVAQALPNLNPAAAAIAAAAAAVVSSKNQQPGHTRSISADRISDPLGLQGINMQMSVPNSQISSNPDFPSSSSSSQLQLSHDSDSQIALSALTSSISIEKIPTDQIDIKGVESNSAQQRTTRADSLFE